MWKHIGIIDFLSEEGNSCELHSSLRFCSLLKFNENINKNNKELLFYFVRGLDVCDNNEN